MNDLRSLARAHLDQYEEGPRKEALIEEWVERYQKTKQDAEQKVDQQRQRDAQIEMSQMQASARLRGMTTVKGFRDEIDRGWAERAQRKSEETTQEGMDRALQVDDEHHVFHWGFDMVASIWSNKRVRRGALLAAGIGSAVIAWATIDFNKPPESVRPAASQGK